MIKEVIAMNAACNAIVQLVNGQDSSAGRLGIFDDSSTAITYLPFSYPAYQDATNGIALANSFTDATAYVDGTASWFGVYDSDGTRLWTGTISDQTGNGDLKLNLTLIPKDTTVSIASGFFTVPA